MEKPILFNTEMVQAIIENRKTCTRIIIKPQPTHSQFGGFVYASGDKRDIGKAMFVNSFPAMYKDTADYIKPLCQAGDILWVRETWRYGAGRGTSTYQYKADMTEHELLEEECSSGWKPDILKWHPSIHMSRAAARIFLKVNNVRVERLQDITEEQAIKEGTKLLSHDGKTIYTKNYKEAFKELWNDIYKNWKENPYVWVIEFEKSIAKK